MSNLLKLSFWFDRPVLPFSANILWLVLIICALAVALGVFSTFLKQKKLKNNRLALKIWQKISPWSYSFGITGLIFAFFKQQMIVYLGMRFWFVLWLLAWFIWLVYILKFILFKVPKIKKEQQQKEEFEKYLP